MASALDHFLNALDITLKAGQRADAVRADEREAAKRSAQRAAGARRQMSFGSNAAADPSCCLAKRRIPK